MRSIEVSASDLDSVCDALLDSFTEWAPTGPYQSLELGCRHCGRTSTSDSPDDIKHGDVCPVLIARDIHPHEVKA